jgi:hypothetical protein
MDRILPFAARILEVMFFTGLVGCAFMIVVSWIEIFSEAFTSDDKENTN